MKKILSLFLILVLIVSSSLPSLAATVNAPGGRTIKIDVVLVDASGTSIGLVPGFSVKPTATSDGFIE